MKTAAVISVDELTNQGAGWAPLEAMLARLRAWGYDGVELAVRDPEQIDAGRLQQALAQAGLPVAALATGTACSVDGLSYTDPDARVRWAAAARIAAHCELAARIGGFVILGLIRGRVWPGMSREDAMAYVREGVWAACEAGQALGVNVLFEPINRYEADLINTADEGVALLDELMRSNLGLLLDTYHMNIEEADICASLLRAGRRVHHVHAADSNRCYPGAGHVDFPAVAAALRELGYAGYLSAEILPRPDALLSLERAAANLRMLVGS